jgi:two-component system cell cycle response regulator
VPGRILVIEDNTANLDLMVYLLGAFGHTTYEARDGEEGLEVAARECPDLIICDIQLPKMDGYDVVRHFKAKPGPKPVPVIAVTALAMVGDRDRVLAAGFDGYLTKPIEPETFVQQIEPYLGTTCPVPTPFSTTSPTKVAHERTKLARILVMDNEPANREFVHSLLEPLGYEVLSVSGGSEALLKAVNKPPDIILSDVCMPDGSGYDFIRAVKHDHELASIPFIFVTSTMMDDQDRKKGLSLGAARFLFRPIEPERLLLR